MGLKPSKMLISAQDIRIEIECQPGMNVEPWSEELQGYHFYG
jgi:hypothetical protein